MTAKRSRAPRRGLATTLACLVVVSALASPAAAQTTESRLNNARRDATKVKSDLERIAEGYGRAADARHLTEEQIYKTNGEITRAKGEIASLQAELKGRIRAIYKMGGIGFFQLMLRAESFRDFNLRMMTTQRQSLADEDLLLDVRRKRAALQVKQRELDSQKTILTKQVEDYRSQARRATISLQQANELVARLRNQLSREEISRLFRMRPSGGGGGRVVPMDACPVDPPHVVTNSWGAPRDGGRRRHQGNDVMADFGLPVRAVNDGTITRTSAGGAGGNAIYLSDGSAEFYYAHLQRVSVGTGQKVSAGQLIGSNGNSGNAQGGPPHVHFEVHPGGGGAIDPYPSLSTVC